MSDSVASCSYSQDKELDNCDGSVDELNNSYIDTSNTSKDVKVFFKLWIYDIRIAPPSPICKHTILFKNKPVDYVIVFGTVTSVVEFTKKILIEIDDCTGNINCIYYPNEELDIEDDMAVSLNDRNFNKPKESEGWKNNAQSEVDTAISHCYDWMEKEIKKNEKKILHSSQSFELGDTVCVKGSITHFYGHREIRVFTIYKIDNLLDECCLIMEKVHLYQNEYDKL